MRHDVPKLVTMLADDGLGKARENTSLPLCDSYYKAFEAIVQDPNN